MLAAWNLFALSKTCHRKPLFSNHKAERIRDQEEKLNHWVTGWAEEKSISTLRYQEGHPYWGLYVKYVSNHFLEDKPVVWSKLAIFLSPYFFYMPVFLIRTNILQCWFLGWLKKQTFWWFLGLRRCKRQNKCSVKTPLLNLFFFL